PSTCTSVERPRWPPMFRPEVGAGPMGRPLSLPTVEIVSAKPVALRSLIGRSLIRSWLIVEATEVPDVSTRLGGARNGYRGADVTYFQRNVLRNGLSYAQRHARQDGSFVIVG